MTQPAEITSRADFELLRLNLHEVNQQIDALYLRITNADDENADKSDEKEEPVADPSTDLDVAAEEEDERQRRVDYETDGELDGDYDIDLDLDGYDDPDAE
ncbi:hypothetical protein [Winogradskya humida]|uniref:Uncharacterized protein n=1 Tax=Winogradskya humida TaxID=113566 RepID=A0ABQ4A201_9ACTN|nr:hypothetical protein [Actinoplanes humidus]GIE24884.1 hypothetical protein Ahu01nite_079860 [Actinoplanes humidus]